MSHRKVTAPVGHTRSVHSLRTQDIRPRDVREIGTRDLRARKLIFNSASHFSADVEVGVLEGVIVRGCHWD